MLRLKFEMILTKNRSVVLQVHSYGLWEQNNVIYGQPLTFDNKIIYFFQLKKCF